MGTVASFGPCPSKKGTRRKKHSGRIHEAHSAPELTQAQGAEGTPDAVSLNDVNNPQEQKKNKRAAVLLNNFHEEYQILADEMPNIVYARVVPNLPEHPMIHGRYCFVRDTESEQDHLSSSGDNQTVASVYMDRSKTNLPIVGISQTSVKKLRQVVRSCISRLPMWIILNVRNDPCLFSIVDDDWLPYTLRDYKAIQRVLADPHCTGKDMDEMEFQAREEVLQDVKALREQEFFFYDDITFFENQPQKHLTCQPDHLLLSEEVYVSIALASTNVWYLRLNFPKMGFPLEEEVDRFVGVFNELCNNTLPRNPFSKTSAENLREINRLFGFLVSGRKLHDETVQLGMTMAYLALRQLHSLIVSSVTDSPLTGMFDQKSIPAPKDAAAASKSSEQNGLTLGRYGNFKKRSECQMLTAQHQRVKAGKFQFVRQVGRYLPFMVQIKEEVDKAIDDCDTIINLREEILETLLELESMNFSFDMDKKLAHIERRNELVHQMERYYMLICFNAYLRDQVPLRFSAKFSDWMLQHPKLYQYLVYLDVSEWYTTVELLKSKQRILLSDSSLLIDELCTKRTTGLANFRQLVGWPIYGTSQPDATTIKRVHLMITTAYWNVALNGRRMEETVASPLKHQPNRVPISMPNMIWICLRDGYGIAHDGEVYTWRLKDDPEEAIVLKGISGAEMEEFEEKFVESIKKVKTPIKLHEFDMDNNKISEKIPLNAEKLHTTKQLFKESFEQNARDDTLNNQDSAMPNIPESYFNYVKKHAEYHRIPIPMYGFPLPAMFDQILRIVVNNARGLFTSAITAQSLVNASAGMGRRHVTIRRPSAANIGQTDWSLPNANEAKIDRIASTNLIFFCENGRERTSLAMTIAGLVYCHLFGFAFGYRVEEEERVSLRGAKYTKGEFQVIQTLIRRIPNGNQVKREVDYVLDRCFDSMSMMHFHIREEIYFTYAKFRDEHDPAKKEKLKHRSLAYLEEYFFLILFNLYLHDCQSSHWKNPFDVWMEKITERCNYMELLNELGFPEFETPDHLRRLRERWRPRIDAKSSFMGIV
ncbi:Paladin [Clonorchis sinensis]|uniref:Paladin n=1 Tax=Clonorchis sinensis TaxID=79923 RepID=A0A3R7H0K0_CLOSI|nr:Paladin [Clonorchis sinensis]